MKKSTSRLSRTALSVVLTATAVFGASWAIAQAPSSHAERSRPNVLLILADDLGYSDLGIYGSEIPTPNLDQLARSGRLMTQHYANPTCSPTRAALLSGTDAHIAGLGSMAETVAHVPAQQGKPGYEGFLNERVLWLPQVLNDAGYHTFMSGKWHLGKEPGHWPRHRGFDQSFALLQGGGSHFAPVPGKPTIPDRVTWIENDKQVQLPANFYSSNTITDKLIGFIDSKRGDGKPFFAYAAFTAPHWPLHAPDEDIAKFKGAYDSGPAVIRAKRVERMKALGLLARDAQPSATMPGTSRQPTWDMLSAEERLREARKMEVYAAMVHNLDRNVGRLIAHLKQIGAYDNTLILFMSDNGAEVTESFFPNNEHTDNSLENIGRPRSNLGYGARWGEVSATPFRHFKGWTSEGGIASPAIVRLPGQSTRLPDLAVPTHVMDIAPSVLELAGIPAPKGTYRGRSIVTMDGTSLAKAWSQATPADSLKTRVLAGELFGGRYVLDGRWKLVSVAPPLGNNGWELYDLSTDRTESRNLAASHPEIVQKLTRHWDDYAKRTGLVYVEDLPRVNIDRGALPMTHRKL